MVYWNANAEKAAMLTTKHRCSLMEQASFITLFIIWLKCGRPNNYSAHVNIKYVLCCIIWLEQILPGEFFACTSEAFLKFNEFRSYLIVKHFLGRKKYKQTKQNSSPNHKVIWRDQLSLSKPSNMKRPTKPNTGNSRCGPFHSSYLLHHLFRS